jgi:hypothetical protein
VAGSGVVGLWGLKAARYYKPGKRGPTTLLEVIDSKGKSNYSNYSGL